MEFRVVNVELGAEIGAKRVVVDVFGDLAEWKVLSWVRNKPTWIEPNIYPRLRDHPELASSLLLLKSPDWSTTIAIYPVSTLETNNNLVVQAGRILANARRVTSGDEVVWVVCARTTSANEEESAVQQVVAHAKGLVNSAKSDQFSSSDFWNGVGDILLSLVPSYPISTFLIDDGWQDVADHRGHSRHLHSFGPWDGFGAPIAEVVAELKDKGVGEVGVWMTLQGYWNGIDPDSDLKDRYECQPYPIARRNQLRGGVGEVIAGDAVAWLPSPNKAEAFWKDWLAGLKEAGIGFVKIDNQASYDALIGAEAEHAQAALWSGMLSAVKATWGSLDRVIMCMSHNERMLNGPGGLDFARPPGRLVYRNSDDFNLKYADNHPDFVRWNVYTSILTRHLALDLDFDMFSTTPGSRWPLYHALLRALGPGPLLVSDAPGEESDLSVLDRLTARDRHGKLVSVKTSEPATVPSARWFWDNVSGTGGGPALVAVTPVPEARGGLIAAWNARKVEGGRRAVDTITRDEVVAALGQGAAAPASDPAKYVIWRVGLSGKAQYQVIGDNRSGIDLTIEKGGCELLVVGRIWHTQGKEMAVLGMLDKLAPLAGMQIEQDEDGLTVRATFAAELTVLVLRTDGASRGLQAKDGGGGDLSVSKDEVDGALLHRISLGHSGPESFNARLR